MNPQKRYTHKFNPAQNSIGSQMSPNTAMKIVLTRLDNQMKSATIFSSEDENIDGDQIMIIQMYLNYHIHSKTGIFDITPRLRCTSSHGSGS